MNHFHLISQINLIKLESNISLGQLEAKMQRDVAQQLVELRSEERQRTEAEVEKLSSRCALHPTVT